MSVVWRGYDEVLRREVAVKVLSPEYAADARLRAGLYREAQAAARLSHPNIAGVFDYGESLDDDGSGATEGDPVPFVVMELIDGISLSERLGDDGTLDWPEAATICAQVGSALAAAHAHGVVHRDVKPGNVMLTPVGAKVVDFGISALVGETDREPAGQVLGTPAYVAPERLAGGVAGTAADVYALGLLFYRMVAGSLPWAAATVTQMLIAHRYVEPEPLPGATRIPAEARWLCTRCLAKEPSDRPTAGEVADALTQLHAGRSRTVVPAHHRDPVESRTMALAADATQRTMFADPLSSSPALSTGSLRALSAGSGSAAGLRSAFSAGPGSDAEPASAAGSGSAAGPGSALDASFSTGSRSVAGPGSAAGPGVSPSARPRSEAEPGSAAGSDSVAGSAAVAGSAFSTGSMPPTAGMYPPDNTGLPARRSVVPVRWWSGWVWRRPAAVGIMAVALVALIGASAWTPGPSRVVGTLARTAGHSATDQCRVRYQVVRSWPHGFDAALTVTNSSGRELPDPTLRFAFPGDQSIRASKTLAQAGHDVTARLARAGQPMPAGTSVELRFTAAYSAENLLPTVFYVGATPCQASIAANASTPASGSRTGPTPAGATAPAANPTPTAGPTPDPGATAGPTPGPAPTSAPPSTPEPSATPQNQADSNG
jgi:serine/threonine-protein kinase